MYFNPGDIVEANDGAPYAVTKPKTQWVVYGSGLNPDGNRTLMVGYVPSSYEKFKENQSLYIGPGLRYRNNRLQDNFKMFTVNPIYFSQVGSMGTNKKFKALLHQGDMWQEEDTRKRYTKKGTLKSRRGLPF